MQIQGDFQSFLLRGDAAIDAYVVGTERVPVATRLAIYGDAYCSRLAEALQTNFPALAKLLGEADFETLATGYVRTHDSPFFSIRHYGNALPDYLTQHPDYAAAPLLAELARWEWAMTEVFDAADAEPIDVSALARVSPEEWSELRFDWHPSVRRLELVWNVPQIWKAITSDAERPAASLVSEPTPWLLWRQELQSYFRSLTAAEAAALDGARSGQPFGELCVLMCTYCSEDDAPVLAAGFLRGWVESGLVARVHSSG
jgi:hypothetical protein